MAKVLVTCVGSGVGQSVIDSLNLVGKDFVIGCDSNRNIFAYNLCHNFYIAPSIYSSNYLKFLFDTCIKEKVDILIPGHDHELLLFSKNIEMFNKSGIEIIVSKPDLIEISRDKFKWYDYFHKEDCAIVPTFRLSDFKKNPDEAILPAIIKPVGGSASQGIHIINDLDELENGNDDDIIQPYLFPLETDKNFSVIQKAVKNGKFVQMSEISIQLIFSKESTFEGIFISKNTLKSGVPVFVDPIDPDEFEFTDEIMKFVPICIDKKVTGPVNLQGRITIKGLIFFEMNMRFTGITGNRAQLGFNEVSFLVNNYLGKRSVLKNFSKLKVGARQVACTTIPRKVSHGENKKTYLILGASGFIGSFFVNDLIHSKAVNQIYLICREESYTKYINIFSSYNQVEIIRESDPSISTYYCLSDILINFASSRANESKENMYNSILFQYKQAKIAAKSNLPLIVNISSQSVYDQNSEEIKNEDTNVKLDSAYAFQKYIGEEFFSSIHQDYPSTKVISLRFSRVVGCSHDKTIKPNGFFAYLIDSLNNNKVVKIPNPLNSINLLDIKDASESILYIINNFETIKFPEILNIGGENLTLQEYTEKVIDVLNFKSKSELIKLGKSEEIKTSSMVNCELAKNHYWEKKISIEDTIKQIYNRLNEID